MRQEYYNSSIRKCSSKGENASQTSSETQPGKQENIIVFRNKGELTVSFDILYNLYIYKFIYYKLISISFICYEYISLYYTFINIFFKFTFIYTIFTI